MRKINFLKLILSLLICQLAGFIGSLFTTPSISEWYNYLEKPSFTPPNWIFSPVWISLFVLMGISLYMVWNKGWKEPLQKRALFFFGTQFVLNILWSIIFFGLRTPFFALLEIILLWISILGTIITFSRVSKKAALLLVPYFLWVSFAAFLNYSLWTLNA